MARRSTWMVAALVLVLIGGCQRAGHVPRAGRSAKMAKSAELRAVRNPPIPDLPVPSGFRLDENRSHSFAEAGIRYVEHCYKYGGHTDKHAVARFYKRHMPYSRWTLVTDMFVKGNVILDFEKDSERCRVTITRGRGFSSVQVQALVWTRGHATVASAR